MPFKDRFRRAIKSDRPGSGSSSSASNSNSESRVPTATNTPGTSGAATPYASHRNSIANPPTITLTKTNTNRLSLSKTLTWSKKSKEEKMAEKQQKRLDYWEQKDRLEWTTPEDGWKRSGKKRSKQHQDMLRAFEFDFSARRRSVSSWISGISPGQSRVGSVVDNAEGSGRPRKRSSTAGNGSTTLSRQVTREEPEDEMDPLNHAPSTIVEA